MTLTTFASKSTTAVYEIIRSPRDGRIYCTCPAWKFSKVEPKSCKHLVAFAHESGLHTAACSCGRAA